VRPTMITNPADDAGFRRAVEQAADRTAGDIAAAERRLRPRYPGAVLRARDISGETFVVWYAYREGVWVSDRRADD
jgi:hypothetical protein